MADNPTVPPKRDRSRLGAIFLTVFLDIVGFSIIFPLFPAMLAWYLPQEGALAGFVESLSGLSSASGIEGDFLATVLFGGILGSLYSLLQFVFAPIWGRLSDRHGRRTILLWTVSGTAIAYLIWVFSGNFWLLILSRLLGGTMSGNLSVATAAVADVTSEKKRSAGMAIIGIAFGLGFILGPAIGGFSSLGNLLVRFPEAADLGIHPFSIPALIALALAVINLIWIWKGLPETLPPEKRGQPGETRTVFGIANAAVRRTNLAYFLFLTAFSGMEFTLTFLAFERLTYGPADNAILFVFVGLVLIVVQGGFVRRMGPKLGEKPLAIAGMVSGVVAMICLAIAEGTLFFYTGLLFLGIGIGLISPTLSALVSRYSDPTEQGKHLGSFRAAGSLARVFGPIAAAAVYWYLGSQTSYLLGAAVILLPLIVAFGLPKPAPEST